MAEKASSHNGEFSIVRHKLLDDEKFEEVYEDDALFGAWVKLLIAADKAFPSPAAVPFGTNTAAYDKLVEVGLLDSLPHHHYIVHGMAAERTERAERFRKAAWARHHKPDATQSDA